MSNIPRAERRRLHRHAVVVAEILAASVLTRDAGRYVPIPDPVAQNVLQRGFTALLRNDCRPVVHRLTDAEAACLPGYTATPPGALRFAAFGLDRDRRGTFVHRWAWAPDLTEAELSDAAEVAVLAALAGACNVSGLALEIAR